MPALADQWFSRLVSASTMPPSAGGADRAHTHSAARVLEDAARILRSFEFLLACSLLVFFVLGVALSCACLSDVTGPDEEAAEDWGGGESCDSDLGKLPAYYMRGRPGPRREAAPPWAAKRRGTRGRGDGMWAAPIPVVLILDPRHPIPAQSSSPNPPRSWLHVEA